MEVKFLNHYNVAQYAEGVMNCLDAFGTINITNSEAEAVLNSKLQDGHVISIVVVNHQVVSTATMLLEKKLIHGGDRKYTKNDFSLIAHIEDLATLPEHRGKGHARSALKLLEEQAKEMGCYKILADVSISNYNDFYSKIDYKIQELCIRKDLT